MHSVCFSIDFYFVITHILIFLHTYRATGLETIHDMYIHMHLPHIYIYISKNII